MKNFICIHGHFYQPPRENPWLETIETQKSAAPFHDWNERIAAECYAPNRAARLLDPSGKITSLIDNYRHISFNFGPTLLSWLEKEDHATYDAIIAADAASFKLHDGHGAAIAQAWGHVILPLANQRDKETQILWGIADFSTRFGRPPEGMWLPEAAVDIESLEAIAAAGILFTILSPFQARRIRAISATEWQQVQEGEIDCGQPYLCRLPSGRSISIFFYDATLSRDVAFGGLLNSGEAFASAFKTRLLPAKSAQLIHIATDGESYGHHHKFGEMALAKAMDHIHADNSLQLTVYASYLAMYPPGNEVEIIPMSSWSCAHGIERWRSDCGCHIGTDPSWNQKWRAPLRNALDQLRDRLIPLYETFAGKLFIAPWTTRDAYIEVINDRSTANVKKFLTREAGRELSAGEENQGLKLLEIQRHAMQMYTSCGWFFDEVSGIETVQLLAYAARAIELTRETCAIDLEPEFREWLQLVPSNLPRWGNAEKIYSDVVISQRVDLRRVAGNYAMAILLGGAKTDEFYCYAIHCDIVCNKRSNNLHLVSGKIIVRSRITWTEEAFSFSALHSGGLGVLVGVNNDDHPNSANDETILSSIFDNGKQIKVETQIKEIFGANLYTLADLFVDERQRTVEQMISSQVSKIVNEFKNIYQDHLGLLHFLHENGLTIPGPLSAAAEQLINEEILLILHGHNSFSGLIRKMVESAKNFDLKLDQQLLAHAASLRCHSLLVDLAGQPIDLHLLAQTIADLDEILVLPWPIDLWQAQNIYFDIFQKRRALREDDVPEESAWMMQFRHLGEILGIRLHP